MDFEQQKQKYMDELGKPDRSRATAPDPQIVPLLDQINRLDHYYTTSSCAGRILILESSQDTKRHQAQWHLVDHEPVTVQQVQEALKNITDGQVWYKMEALILHICCKDLESAQTLLNIAQQSGCKHSGIISTTPRIMVEIVDATRCDSLIANKGQLLVDNKHIEQLVNLANQKLKFSRKRLTKIKEKIQNL